MSRNDTMTVRLEPSGPITGDLSVPGDKSISHRAALIGSIACGETRIRNYATNLDCASTLSALRSLGCTVSTVEDEVRLVSPGRTGYRTPGEAIDVGNAGTTIRLMMGILAGADLDVSITGDRSIRQRPMERVAGPLRDMGARIETAKGCAPVRVQGRSLLRPIDFEGARPSAQVKSAVLLAGLVANGHTVVRERPRTRDHTERMLTSLGVDVDSEGDAVAVLGPVAPDAGCIDVPGDFSSAAFLVGMALTVPGSEVRIHDVGLNPTRIRLLDLFADLGADVELSDQRTVNNELRGTIRASYRDGLGAARTGPLEIGGRTLAEIIDEVPILAVVGASSTCGVRFTDAGELRHKESDRISAMVDGLRRMGCDVETWEDGFRVAGSAALHGAELDSYGDHRIAMALSCAALRASGSSTIAGAECVAISFPEFFDLLPPGSVVRVPHEINSDRL